MGCTPLTADIFIALFYALGGFGFFAITALPVRAWRHLHRHRGALRGGAAQCLAYLLLVLASIAAITFAGACLLDVARCLLGLYCGPNIASGWIRLGSISVLYLSFELFAFVIIRTTLRRRVPDGTSA